MAGSLEQGIRPYALCDTLFNVSRRLVLRAYCVVIRGIPAHSEGILYGKSPTYINSLHHLWYKVLSLFVFPVPVVRAVHVYSGARGIGLKYQVHFKRRP